MRTRRLRWKAFIEGADCPRCGDRGEHCGILPSGFQLCVRCGYRAWRHPPTEAAVRRPPPPKAIPSKAALLRCHKTVEFFLQRLPVDRTLEALRKLRRLPPELADVAVKMGCRLIEPGMALRYRIRQAVDGPLYHVDVDYDAMERTHIVSIEPPTRRWTEAFVLPMAVRVGGRDYFHHVQFRLYGPDVPRFIYAKGDSDWPVLGFSYVPPAVTDSQGPPVVAVCEGFFKAVALRHLYPSWGVVWLAGGGGDVRTLARFVRTLRPAAVVLVPDADIWYKAEVLAMWVRVALALWREAGVPMRATFLLFWDRRHGKGIDDVCVDYGARAGDLLSYGLFLEVCAMRLDDLPQDARRFVERKLWRRAMLVGVPSRPPSEVVAPAGRLPEAGDFHASWLEALRRSPLVVDRSAVGTGKTHASTTLRLTKEWRAAGFRRVVLLSCSPLNYPVPTPRHFRFVGRTDRGWERGADGRWRPAEAPVERDDATHVAANCPYASVIQAAIARGLIRNVAEDWCESPQGACPLRETCGYYRQMAAMAGRRYAVMHPAAYMQHRHQGDLVILDEFPTYEFIVQAELMPSDVLRAAEWAWRAGVAALAAYLHQLAGAMVRGDRDAMEMLLADASRRVMSYEVWRRHEAGGVRARAVDALRRAVFEAGDVAKAIEAVGAYDAPPGWLSAVLLDTSRPLRWSLGERGRLVLVAPRRDWRPAIEAGVRFLVLSATPDMDLIKFAFGVTPEVVAQAEATARPLVAQVFAGRVLKNRTSLKRIGEWTRLARRAVTFVRSAFGVDGPLGILTLKRFESAFREAFPEAAVVGYFGADDRGSNRFVDCDVLLIAGLQMRNLSTVLTEHGIDSRRGRGLRLEGRALYMMDDIGVMVFSPESPDPKVQEVVQDELRRSYEQAIGRLRQARTDRMKVAVVLDAVWTGIVPDAVIIPRGDDVAVANAWIASRALARMPSIPPDVAERFRRLASTLEFSILRL